MPRARPRRPCGCGCRTTGETIVEDVIRGASAFENRLLDDFVIARSDRTPLYNFAVAVDDSEMGITHVVRGEDHLSNTPRQLLVLAALGADTALYAHLPLLHGTDGKPLSKRHGAASVQELRDAGYLPEAVRNYLALLGWGYDETTTFFSTEELVERFSLERVSRSPAVFDEQKLRWMNGHYIRELRAGRARRRGCGSGCRSGPPGADDPRLERGAAAAQEKMLRRSPSSATWSASPSAPLEIDEGAWEKVMGKDGAARRARPGARGTRSGRAVRRAARRGGAARGSPTSWRRSRARSFSRPGRHHRPHGFGRDLRELVLLGKEESLARIDGALALADALK